MNLCDRFEISGVVQKTRVIMPKKADSNWRQYVIVVAGLGKVFHLKTEDEKLFLSVGIGQTVRATGDFSFFNNIPQFDVARIEQLDD